MQSISFTYKKCASKLQLFSFKINNFEQFIIIYAQAIELDLISLNN